MKSKSVSIFIFSIFLFLNSGCSAQNPFKSGDGMNEKAMNCRPITPKSFEELLSILTSQPIYNVKDEQSIGNVKFILNIPDYNPEVESETHLFIESPYTPEHTIYSGPLKTELIIKIDENFLKQEGFDSLTFKLFRKKQNQTCVLSQKTFAKYWQPGATVNVNFLVHRYIDEETKELISFDVNVEKL